LTEADREVIEAFPEAEIWADQPSLAVP
jgi:hypothetical protein